MTSHGTLLTQGSCQVGWWCTPLIQATWEDDVGLDLEFKINLGNTAKSHLKNNTNYKTKDK